MKTAQRTALTVALFAALAGGQAMAADFSPASGEFSGADNTVVAQAAVSGTALSKFNADVVAMPASGEFSGADQVVTAQAKSREEVRAEVATARRAGELFIQGDSYVN